MRSTALRILTFLVIIAIARDFIANGRPLWCKVEGKVYWPAFRAWVTNPSVSYGSVRMDQLESDDNWHSLYAEGAIFTIIPYSPRQKSQSNLPPGSRSPNKPARFRHWLGTDVAGRDVLSGTIYGIRTAAWTGSLAMLVALLLGGFLGSVAGYFGDQSFWVRKGVLWVLLLGFLPAIWFAFFAPPEGSIFDSLPIEGLLFVGFIFICYIIGIFISKIPLFAKTIAVPLDLLILRFAEIFEATPALMVLIAVSCLLTDNSLFWMMALVGVISWPGVARYLRAELLRIRQMDYIAAARNLGFSEWRILWRHALPNAMRPVWGVFALGMSSAILLEAALSFLGLADADLETVTWGRMLHAAQNDFGLWWVWLSPGVMICVTVYCLFQWGEEGSR